MVKSEKEKTRNDLIREYVYERYLGQDVLKAFVEDIPTSYCLILEGYAKTKKLSKECIFILKKVLEQQLEVKKND
jgi:hypothetical protein